MSSRVLRSSPTVSDASRWSLRLCEAKAKALGISMAEAIKHVGRDVKTAPNTIRDLLYRPPTRVYVEVYDALKAGIHKLISQEIKALENELVEVRSRPGDLDFSEIAEIEADIKALRARLKGAVK